MLLAIHYINIIKKICTADIAQEKWALECKTGKKIGWKTARLYMRSKFYLLSAAQAEVFKISPLFDGKPRPSNRTSSPPMLLKWLWPRGFWDNVEWRILKDKYRSDESVHCSFMLNLLITRSSSGTRLIFVSENVVANGLQRNDYISNITYRFIRIVIFRNSYYIFK